MADEACTGLFGPCSNTVTHHMDDPDGAGPAIPFCDEHWDCAMMLEKALEDNPEFAKRFEKAIDKASIPTRYERKPVI